MLHIQIIDSEDLTQTAHLTAMIQSFYSEYDTSIPMTATKIQLSIQHFTRHPESGSVVLLYEGHSIVGYAILVHFWSNEYGGDILFTDELYVEAAHRNTGIGSSFFSLLEKLYPETKVLALEVSPANKKAAKLYTSLGFIKNKNATMFKIMH